jgi:hypothetical protein
MAKCEMWEIWLCGLGVSLLMSSRKWSHLGTACGVAFLA